MIWSTVAAASSSLLLRTATAAYHRRPSPAIWSLAIAASSSGEKIEVSGRVPRATTAATTSFSRRSSSSSRAMGDSGFGRFPLSQNSVLCIEKGDITAWFVNGTSDAIVNAANEKMLGGGGIDGAIHWAAGPELRAACLKSPEVRPGVRCPTGEARITPAFRLPVAHVIHTVGPIYRKDAHSEVFLRKSYRSCLTLAKANGIDHIAFPAISCGVFGYPYEEASTVAISTVKEFANDFKEVHFVLFSDDIHQIWLDSARKLL